MLLLYYLDSFIVILYYCNYINYYSCVIYFFGNSCRFWLFNYLISRHLFFLRKYWNKKNLNNVINMVYFIIVNNKSRSVSARFCFYFPTQLRHLPVHSTVNILYLFYSQSNLTPETSNYKLYRQLKQTVLNVLN